MSARCDSLPRSARIPPCTFGCSVTTRWSSISGKPVTLGERAAPVRRPPRAPRGAARRHELPAELVQPAGELDDARLVPHREQRRAVVCAHSGVLLPSSRRSSERPQHLRVQAALDVLDPLVQRVDGVVGEHRHRFLGQDRPVVDLERGQVHGTAGDLHARGQRVVHRVPALERGQQRRMRVHDRVRDTRRGSAGRGSVPKPAMATRSTSYFCSTSTTSLGVRGAVEVGAEGRALDELGRDARALRALECGTRAIGDHHRDRQVGVDERLEDGAAARRQDPEAPAPPRPHGRASLDVPTPGAVATARRSATRWKLPQRPTTDGGRGSLKSALIHGGLQGGVPNSRGTKPSRRPPWT